MAAIDQPLHEGSLGAVDRRTGPVAYYRFHGRNYASWFAEGRPTHERYDYLYGKEELEPWVGRIKEAADDAAVKAVVAITNNHYQGQAAVNALQLEIVGLGPPRGGAGAAPGSLPAGAGRSRPRRARAARPVRARQGSAVVVRDGPKGYASAFARSAVPNASIAAFQKRSIDTEKDVGSPTPSTRYHPGPSVRPANSFSQRSTTPRAIA